MLVMRSVLASNRQAGIVTTIGICAGLLVHAFFSAFLGMGTDNEIDLYVDADARMDMAELDRALAECLDSRNPVLMTVAVLGSVEESAADPLESILELRDRFHVHYYQNGKADDIHKYQFFLTRTVFQLDDYGPTFMDNYAKRLGLSRTPDSMKVLRSVMMNPHLSDLPLGGSFLDEIIEILRSNVTEIIKANFR